jgi:hypothetical protein
MTLADEAQKDVEVDHLVTLGEGLNLAWRLTTGDDGVVDEETRLRYDRLYTDVFRTRPELTWNDFWASQDPAPVGVVTPPDAKTMDNASLNRIRSHAVWNRLAFREDHGTYWDNDEEFLIPLARLLDDNPVGARMFPDTANVRMRSQRRRRRLTVLSILRQLVLVAPTAAIVSAFVYGSDYVTQAGLAVAHVWGMLPGQALISDPLNTIRRVAFDDQGRVANDAVKFLAEGGTWIVAAMIGLLTLVALLPPPERPVPWYDDDEPWWHPFNLFSLVLRAGPWILATPVVVAVVQAWVKFSGGATPTAQDVGVVVLGVFVATALIAGGAGLMLGSPWKIGWAPSWLRDGVEKSVTIVVMAVFTVLAVAPFAAILVYEAVGTTVLGVAAVIAAFQIVGQIGIWRWNVWDGRERVAARTQSAYPPLHRIVVQIVLILATVALGFLAVVQNSLPFTIAAVAVAAGSVLLGVAVDVFDTARQQRRSPLDAMLQGASHL